MQGFHEEGCRMSMKRWVQGVHEEGGAGAGAPRGGVQGSVAGGLLS